MSHPAPFQADRVGIVDKIGTSVLVRGTEPLIGEDLRFAYEEIAAAVKMDFTNYDFIDVCLIDNVSERWAFVPEVKAHGIDPDKDFPSSYWPPYLQRGYDAQAFHGRGIMANGKVRSGRLVWWPIEGVPKGQDAKVYLGSPGWDFSGLIEYLMQLGKSFRNSIIYFHCMVGSDRTGATHIGYLMKAKGMSKVDAIAASRITQAPLPRLDYMDLVDAYAKSIGK